MKLVSMKLDKKREDDDCASPCGEVERPDYPWGTRLNLADEQLAKLGLPAMPAAGAVLDVIARGEVIGVREEQVDGETRRSLEIQLVELGVEAPGKSLADRMYPAKD